MTYDRELVEGVLREARTLVAGEIDRLIDRRRQTDDGPLYDLVADYPFREGKGLRPGLCLAACRAVGGRTDQALTSATALELFHNASLLHDDVEDASDLRRGSQTMLAAHGTPVAVNVGDATNVLAMGPLLDNVAAIGVRKALLVLRDVERMARESVEGQAMELAWIADGAFDLDDRDYVHMAYKKTCWYTVIAPLRIGVVCGTASGAPGELETTLRDLIELGFHAGVAFQVQDDLLNLLGDVDVYGKEAAGDLWEGKRTVMLLHFMRTADEKQRARALTLLTTPRPEKSPEQVHWLLAAMREAGSLEHGRRVALEHCERALALDATDWPTVDGDSDDRRFLREMLRYVIDRVK